MSIVQKIILTVLPVRAMDSIIQVDIQRHVQDDFQLCPQRFSNNKLIKHPPSEVKLKLIALCLLAPYRTCFSFQVLNIIRRLEFYYLIKNNVYLPLKML